MSLKYLISLPKATQHKDFVLQFRTSLPTNENETGVKAIFGYRIPEVFVEQIPEKEAPKRFAEAQGKAKRTIINVRVNDSGTGICTYNGHHYSEFRMLYQRLFNFRYRYYFREILMCPLILTDLLGKVDIRAEHVIGSEGETMVPKAIGHGIALCVAALFPEHREVLRLAGLLTLDVRKKERSKINQPGARAKWIWKKR